MMASRILLGLRSQSKANEFAYAYESSKLGERALIAKGNIIEGIKAEE